MRFVLLVALVAISACSSSAPTLAKPDGRVFRLNPDRWGETVNDVPMASR